MPSIPPQHINLSIFHIKTKYQTLIIITQTLHQLQKTNKNPPQPSKKSYLIIIRILIFQPFPPPKFPKPYQPSPTSLVLLQTHNQPTSYLSPQYHQLIH